MGSLDLDLPDPPEGSTPPPIVADTPKFQPKAEIAHIFRVPETCPAAELSYTFLALTLLPLVGFFVGLFLIGANVKYFPTSGFHLLAAVGFHVGIGAILALCFLFWLKVGLVSFPSSDGCFHVLQLKSFHHFEGSGFLGPFTSLTGHYILSYTSPLPCPFF